MLTAGIPGMPAEWLLSPVQLGPFNPHPAFLLVASSPFRELTRGVDGRGGLTSCKKSVFGDMGWAASHSSVVKAVLSVFLLLRGAGWKTSHAMLGLLASESQHPYHVADCPALSAAGGVGFVGYSRTGRLRST